MMSFGPSSAAALVGPAVDFAGARLDIQSLTAADAHWEHDALSALLRNVVDAGACIGFPAPLSHEEATRYWVALQPALDVNHTLWIARVADRVVGSVQLHGCDGADARHRAEVSRLMVHVDMRLRGIAAAMMAALERHAVDTDRSLLVLDVDNDSAADTALTRLGWQRAGQVPGYAASSSGELRAFARLYKTLTPQPG